LFAGLTQPMTPPQLMSPVGQMQTLAPHVAPGWHLLPQAPQLLLSVCSFTQPMIPPQYVSPGAHWQENPPGAVALAAHEEPGPQTFPHVPQLAFVVFDVHVLLHTIWPVGQAWH
jgi:hypothetical protein